MWFDVNWAARAPILIEAIGVNDATVDATVPIPFELDSFWLRVKSDGTDLRVTQADGRTLIPFKRQTWTHASRSGVLQLDAVPSAAGQTFAFVYWRNAAASEGATNPTIASPRNGSIWGGRTRGLPTVRVLPERIGATRPRVSLRKGVAEQLRIFWDFSDRLEAGARPGRRIEELQRLLAVDVLDEESVSQAGAMVVHGKARAHEGGLSTWIQAGTAGHNYTMVCRVETTFGHVLEARARLQVNDVGV